MFSKEYCFRLKNRISFSVVMASLTAMVVAGVIAFLVSLWSFPDTTFPLGKGEKTKIETDIRQSFVSYREGLSDIRILLGGSDTSGGGTLVLALFEHSCDAGVEPIRIVRQRVQELDAEDTESFRFNRIPDSFGKVYCFRLSFEAGKGSKKATIFVRPNDIPDRSPSLSINGAEADSSRSIAFRPAYRNETFVADLGELFDRISQYKPIFLKGASLMAMAIFSLMFSFAFFILVVRAVQHDHQGDQAEKESKR